MNRRRVLLSGTVFTDEAALSPDGGRLAYQAVREMIVTDLATGERVRFGAGPGGTPSWSPDGQRLAFSSSVQNPKEPVEYISQVQIVIVGRSGARERRVLTNRFDAENAEPIFSPDGTKIAYQHGGDLRMVGVNGVDDYRLTSAGGAGDECPAFAPDGSKLAFTRIGGERTAALMIVDADGTNRVTVSTASDGA